ncbi:hypothetical protein NSB25_04660 [Acetatifactor muris]|uniref:hypothetical protein n=1 Tax=Acetatifactor muris TaxID=879566 RepID=UPI000CCFD482|nr:hypothetical protein [Acetatifactor muris]MCR2046569.1 hypothetical protein [Acetatifactor muris]
MNESRQLSKRLYEIQTLSLADIKQIRRLLIDFFAAAYAGAKQNKKFNNKVEKVLFAQGGKGEASVLFTEKNCQQIWRHF